MAENHVNTQAKKNEVNMILCHVLIPHLIMCSWTVIAMAEIDGSITFQTLASKELIKWIRL